MKKTILIAAFALIGGLLMQTNQLNAETMKAKALKSTSPISICIQLEGSGCYLFDLDTKFCPIPTGSKADLTPDHGMMTIRFDKLPKVHDFVVEAEAVGTCDAGGGAPCSFQTIKIMPGTYHMEGNAITFMIATE